MNLNDDLTKRLRQRDKAFTVYQQAADEIERLRKLIYLFDNYWICEECDLMAATYLQGCKNPLHALQDYLYNLDGFNGN